MILTGIQIISTESRLILIWTWPKTHTNCCEFEGPNHQMNLFFCSSTTLTSRDKASVTADGRRMAFVKSHSTAAVSRSTKTNSGTRWHTPCSCYYTCVPRRNLTFKVLKMRCFVDEQLLSVEPRTMYLDNYFHFFK